MTPYVHIARIGPGTCAVVTAHDVFGRAIDVCGCRADGIEPTEDEGWVVCVNCGHDIREVLADELAVPA